MYDSHYRALWKRQHHGTSKMIISFQSLEEGNGEQAILYDTITLGTCHYTNYIIITMLISIQTP